MTLTRNLNGILCFQTNFSSLIILRSYHLCYFMRLDLLTNQPAARVMAVDWGEKRLSSWKPQAYLEFKDVTRKW